MTYTGIVPRQRAPHRPHDGAPEENTKKAAATGGWACSYHEGGPPQGNPRTDAPAWASGCHYCRIMRVAQAVNSSFQDEVVEVSGLIAAALGLDDGAKVPPLDAIRAACQIAGDDALLNIIDRLTPTEGEHDG